MKNIVLLHLFEVARLVKLIETENRIVVARGGEGGGNGGLFTGSRISVLQDEKILEIGCTM